MTDSYIEQVLINTFLTLNEFSGVPYIKKDGNGRPLNVSIPNVPFIESDDKHFFILSFLPNAPEPAGMGENAKNRWTGIFQIDIMVPLGAGTDEAAAKYEWINKLFQRGKSFKEIMVKRTYRVAHEAELAYYRTVVRIEFIALLSK
jgi:hypothetical protein